MKKSTCLLAVGLAFCTQGAWAVLPAGQYPWQLLKEPKFRQAYHKALGSRQKEAWLGKLSGPASLVVRRTINGVEYVLASSCMAHSCGSHHLNIAYVPAQGKVAIRLVEETRITWLGEESPQARSLLESF